MNKLREKLWFKIACCVNLMFFFTYMNLAYAGDLPSDAVPTGGVVTGGSATIGTVQGNTLPITQASTTAVIDWGSFNVGSARTVAYTVPNGGATLNRDNSGQTSVINGTVTSNGLWALVNSAGVSINGGAVINVQSAIISSLGITNEDFLDGAPYTFNSATNPGVITHNGTITVTNLCALLGGRISINNPGIINAENAQLALGVGKNIVVAFDNGLVSLTNTEPVTANQGGTSGTNGILLGSGANIAARGNSRVLMSLNAAQGVFNNAVNLDGLLNADTIVAGGPAGSVIITTAANSGHLKLKKSDQLDANSGITGAASVQINNTNYTTVPDWILNNGVKIFRANVMVDGVSNVRIRVRNTDNSYGDIYVPANQIRGYTPIVTSDAIRLNIEKIIDGVITSLTKLVDGAGVVESLNYDLGGGNLVSSYEFNGQIRIVFRGAGLKNSSLQIPLGSGITAATLSGGNIILTTVQNGQNVQYQWGAIDNSVGPYNPPPPPPPANTLFTLTQGTYLLNTAKIQVGGGNVVDLATGVTTKPDGTTVAPTVEPNGSWTAGPGGAGVHFDASTKAVSLNNGNDLILYDTSKPYFNLAYANSVIKGTNRNITVKLASGTTTTYNFTTSVEASWGFQITQNGNAQVRVDTGVPGEPAVFARIIKSDGSVTRLSAPQPINLANGGQITVANTVGEGGINTRTFTVKRADGTTLATFTIFRENTIITAQQVQQDGSILITLSGVTQGASNIRVVDSSTGQVFLSQAEYDTWKAGQQPPPPPPPPPLPPPFTLPDGTVVTPAPAPDGATVLHIQFPGVPGIVDINLGKGMTLNDFTAVADSSAGVAGIKVILNTSQGQITKYAYTTTPNVTDTPRQAPAPTYVLSGLNGSRIEGRIDNVLGVNTLRALLFLPAANNRMVATFLGGNVLLEQQALGDGLPTVNQSAQFTIPASGTLGNNIFTYNPDGSLIITCYNPQNVATSITAISANGDSATTTYTGVGSGPSAGTVALSRSQSGGNTIVITAAPNNTITESRVINSKSGTVVNNNYIHPNPLPVKEVSAGQWLCSDGKLRSADGLTEYASNGDYYITGGYKYNQNGTYQDLSNNYLYYNPGEYVTPEGYHYYGGGQYYTYGENTYYGDRYVTGAGYTYYNNGNVLTPDGSILRPDGSRTTPDGTIYYTNGTYVRNGITYNTMDGRVYGADDVTKTIYTPVVYTPEVYTPPPVMNTPPPVDMMIPMQPMNMMPMDMMGMQPMNMPRGMDMGPMTGMNVGPMPVIEGTFMGYVGPTFDTGIGQFTQPPPTGALPEMPGMKMEGPYTPTGPYMGYTPGAPDQFFGPTILDGYNPNGSPVTYGPTETNFGPMGPGFDVGLGYMGGMYGPMEYTPGAPNQFGQMGLDIGIIPGPTGPIAGVIIGENPDGTPMIDPAGMGGYGFGMGPGFEMYRPMGMDMGKMYDMGPTGPYTATPYEIGGIYGAMMEAFNPQVKPEGWAAPTVIPGFETYGPMDMGKMDYGMGGQEFFVPTQDQVLGMMERYGAPTEIREDFGKMMEGGTPMFEALGALEAKYGPAPEEMKFDYGGGDEFGPMLMGLDTGFFGGPMGPAGPYVGPGYDFGPGLTGPYMPGAPDQFGPIGPDTRFFGFEGHVGPGPFGPMDNNIVFGPGDTGFFGPVGPDTGFFGGPMGPAGPYTPAPGGDFYYGPIMGQGGFDFAPRGPEGTVPGFGGGFDFFAPAKGGEGMTPMSTFGDYFAPSGFGDYGFPVAPKGGEIGAPKTGPGPQPGLAPTPKGTKETGVTAPKDTAPKATDKGQTVTAPKATTPKAGEPLASKGAPAKDTKGEGERLAAPSEENEGLPEGEYEGEGRRLEEELPAEAPLAEEGAEIPVAEVPAEPIAEGIEAPIPAETPLGVSPELGIEPPLVGLEALAPAPGEPGDQLGEGGDPRGAPGSFDRRVEQLERILPQEPEGNK